VNRIQGALSLSSELTKTAISLPPDPSHQPGPTWNFPDLTLFKLPRVKNILIPMDYLEMMKGFLLSPLESFRKVRETDWGDSLRYYLILLVINAILSAIVSIGMASTAWTSFSALFTQAGVPLPAVTGAGVIVYALGMIIVQFVLVFIGAAWLHLFVYILGGRRGYLQTLKALTFGSTPAMLFGWIPFIGLLAGIWSLILGIFGIRELHDMTTVRAAIAVILSVLVVLLIIIVIAAFFLIAYSVVTPVPVSVP